MNLGSSFIFLVFVSLNMYAGTKESLLKWRIITVDPVVLTSSD